MTNAVSAPNEECRRAYSRFVLKYRLGHDEIENYDGSWTEWGNLVGAPVATGVPLR